MLTPTLPFDFLIQRRPLSVQTKRRSSLQKWKAIVRAEAARAWPLPAPLETGPLSVTLVYLCGDAPADIDNIIKPIQDALVGLIFADDSLVADVASHRRSLDEEIDVTELPPLLQTAVLNGEECVFVRVDHGRDLKDYL